MKLSAEEDAFSHNFPAKALGFEMKIVREIHHCSYTPDVPASTCKIKSPEKAVKEIWKNIVLVRL